MRRKTGDEVRQFGERPARLYRHLTDDTIQVIDIGSLKQLKGELEGYVKVEVKETTPNFVLWLVRFHDTTWAEISTPRSSTFETALRWVLQGQS